MDDAIADAVEALRHEHGFDLEVEDRTIVLGADVRGDPGSTVLRVLSLAEAASPVGAACSGPTGIAIGVWRSPELYLARWTKGKRWVVGYRLPGGSTVRHYVRIEGRIPTRLEIGNWYGPVPEDVGEAFFEAGLLVDDPPFPIPAPPPPPPPPAARAAPGVRPAAKRAPAAPRTARPPAASRAAPPRVCPSCRMHKVPGQFVPGSDLCVDCR